MALYKMTYTAIGEEGPKEGKIELDASSEKEARRKAKNLLERYCTDVEISKDIEVVEEKVAA